jgi:hypothetical protein
LDDCPHCGSKDTLIYGLKDMDIDDDGFDTVPIEGLICSECQEIFMSLDESARLLNLKAKHDGLDTYYGVHDGDIKETRLQ